MRNFWFCNHCYHAGLDPDCEHAAKRVVWICCHCKHMEVALAGSDGF